MAHLKLEAPELLGAEGGVEARRRLAVEPAYLTLHQLADGAAAAERRQLPAPWPPGANSGVAGAARDRSVKRDDAFLAATCVHVRHFRTGGRCRKLFFRTSCAWRFWVAAVGEEGLMV
jgi:hypothetical protein